MQPEAGERGPAIRRGRGPRAACLALALLLAPACTDPAPPADDRWNVLVVCLDTVRFDSFWLPERAGLSDAFSPWAARALRFQRTLSTSPWTLPAVASLLTGRYPSEHGAGFDPDEVAEIGRRPPAPLPSALPTLGELLAERGYRAGGFVANPFFSQSLGLNRTAMEVEIEADAWQIVEQASAWLDAGPPEPVPFFLYLHWMDGHTHFQRSAARKQEAVDSLPEAVRAAALAAAPGGVCDSVSAPLCRTFLAYTHEVLKQREALAHLLGDLESRGLLGRTLVVVYSDHGEEFLDHEAEQHERAALRGRDGVTGLGHGHAMYQELLHVPLLVWHPQRGGAEVEVGASLVDVAPTILDWLGEPAPEGGMSGISLARATPPAARPRFASAIALGPPEAVVVRGRWKLIQRRMPDEQLLFDLEADPGERVPVADPELTRELEALLASYGRAEPPPAEPAPPLGEDALRALQALGYLEDAKPE